MIETLIIQKAVEELEAQNFGVTGQFLEIHQVVHERGIPKMARLDMEREDGTAVVYFHVVDQKFYFAVYLDVVPNITVTWVDTVPFHSVYFRAYSEEYYLHELAAWTKLPATRGKNKGEKRRPDLAKGVVWTRSIIDFEPNPEPEEFDVKLHRLLDFLEQDREGIGKLVLNADGYIQVYTSFHNGNTLLGGHHLHKDQIRRMSSLHLGIDFDISADGNFFE